MQAALPDAHNQFRHFEPRPSIVNGNNNTSTSSSPPVGVIPIQQLNNNRNGSAFNSLSNVTVPTTTIALPLRQFAGANITAINETTTAANSIRTLPPYLRRKCRDTDMNCFVWVSFLISFLQIFLLVFFFALKVFFITFFDIFDGFGSASGG